MNLSVQVFCLTFTSVLYLLTAVWQALSQITHCGRCLPACDLPCHVRAAAFQRAAVLGFEGAQSVTLVSFVLECFQVSCLGSPRGSQMLRCPPALPQRCSRASFWERVVIPLTSAFAYGVRSGSRLTVFQGNFWFFQDLLSFELRGIFGNCQPALSPWVRFKTACPVLFLCWHRTGSMATVGFLAPPTHLFCRFPLNFPLSLGFE